MQWNTFSCCKNLVQLKQSQTFFEFNRRDFRLIFICSLNANIMLNRQVLDLGNAIQLKSFMFTGKAALFPLKGGSLTQSLFTIMCSAVPLLAKVISQEILVLFCSFTSFSQSLWYNLPSIPLFLLSYLLLQSSLCL